MQHLPSQLTCKLLLESGVSSGRSSLHLQPCLCMCSCVFVDNDGVRVFKGKGNNFERWTCQNRKKVT